MADKLPCDGMGWSFPGAHCAPPVGYKEDGFKCEKCPWTVITERGPEA